MTPPTLDDALASPSALARRAALPPGPRPPAPLQAAQWLRSPLPFLQRAHERFGDVFTIRVAHAGPWVILSDPADVKAVFTADAAALGVAEASAVLGPLLGRRSVMLLEEPEHMTRRRLVLPAFHGRRMQGYGDMTAGVAREEVARWPVGEPFELWPRMQAITLEAIMRVVFGRDDAPRLHEVRASIEQLTAWINDQRRLTATAILGPRWLAANRGFRRARGRAATAVLAEVRRRRAEPGAAERDDVLAMLDAGRYPDGSPLTDEDLADELITLLSDGPTSTSLAWSFERLLRHPDKLTRLREELAAGDDTYLEAVIRETLRLYPPVPVVVRRLLAPLDVRGHRLPAGTIVAPCVYLMHRREELYPDAERFAPERFLGQAPGTYTWIPFGGGVRRCLAASFAMQEMRQVIRAVVEEVELRPTASRSEDVARSSIAFVPDRRATVVVQRRLEPGAAPPLTSAGQRPDDGCPV